MELSTTSLDEMVQPAHVAVADVHARPLPHVLQVAEVVHLGRIVGIVVLRIGILGRSSWSEGRLRKVWRIGETLVKLLDGSQAESKVLDVVVGQ